MAANQPLGMAPFRERFPWLGPDLQTLRNTLRAPKSRSGGSLELRFLLEAGDCLLARLDHPKELQAKGLVIVIHGLGGSSDDESQRRLGRALAQQSFAVLRLNLRGAGPGRPLARGTYAAACSSDLLPVLQDCRDLARALAPIGNPLPLAAVGLSLGGTVLLNALLDKDAHGTTPLLDALVCISSPLDLVGCADCFERPRNRLYHRWLVHRLIAQTLADPHGLSDRERSGLSGANRPQSIRAFDALITAPRWGYADVMTYYRACSPLQPLRHALPHLPPLLIVHAKDDPWVPVDPALCLAEAVDKHQRQTLARRRPWPLVWITDGGGHNGFHSPGDTEDGCWSDRLAALWLGKQLAFGL